MAVLSRLSTISYRYQHKLCHNAEGAAAGLNALTPLVTGHFKLLSEKVRCAFFDRNLHSRSAIEVHAFAPLEASRRVTNGIPLGCSLILPVRTVNCVQTLKAGRAWYEMAAPDEDPSGHLGIASASIADVRCSS
jgi:hypothetical protein